MKNCEKVIYGQDGQYLQRNPGSERRTVRILLSKKAMLYIQENFGRRDISLDDVSGRVNISPYYFSKIFKEETGENFIEYLTRIRIEKAKEFLKQPEVSVKEAGVQSGYTDCELFQQDL